MQIKTIAKVTILLLYTILSKSIMAQPLFLPNQLFVKFKNVEAIHTDKNWQKFKSKFSIKEETAFKSKELETILVISGQNIESKIAEIQKNPVIEYVEKVPNYTFLLSPNDPQYAMQWNLSKISADLAWNISTGSSNIKIAVVDDGFLLNHEDLTNQWYINTNEIPNNGIDDDGNGYVDDWRGWDAADNDNNPAALNPTNNYFTHGTHVSGIVAAATNNSLGIASIGYNCKLIPIKIGANSGGGLTNAYQGVEYAIISGAKVMNMSWGGGGYSQTYQLLFDLAYSKGMICVAAAGNSSSSFQFYPASYNHVISVAASDNTDKLATFTNYGTTIDVTAPGVGILSTLAGATNSYGNLSGTSMASPLTAGLCALMLSNNPGLSPDSLELCLKNNCDNIDAQNPNYIGELGAGRINAYKALLCTRQAPVSNFTVNSTYTCVNSQLQFTALSSGVNPLSYSWSFPGGNPSTSTLPNPIVTYPANGVFTVSLTTSNSYGNDLETKTNYITIIQPSAQLSGNLTNLATATGYLTINFSNGSAPYSVTISDGTNSFTQNNITQNPYSFPVTPTADTTNYTITSFSANGCVGLHSGTSRVIKRKLSTGNDLNCLRVKSHQLIAQGLNGFNETISGELGLGTNTSALGDWDNDGVKDILVGAPYYAYPSFHSGALYLMKLNANGTVKNYDKIATNAGGFSSVLSSNDVFGTGNCVIGDLDNDGVKDIATRKIDGNIYIFFMNSNSTIRSQVLLSNGINGVPAGLFPVNDFAFKITPLGDLNGDGNEDIAASNHWEYDNGPNRGAVYILFLNSNGTLQSYKKLGSSYGVTGINDGDVFGYCEYMGDIDGDGLKEIAVGAMQDDDGGTDRGAVYIISVDNSGNYVKQVKINSSSLGAGVLFNSDYFGQFVNNIGDYDHDGVIDMAVAATGENNLTGGIYIILLNSNLTIKKFFRVNNTMGNFTGNLNQGGLFGEGIVNIGDLDGNGFDDFAVGNHLSNKVGFNKGAVWILFMEDTCRSVVINCPTNSKKTIQKCKNQPVTLSLTSGSNFSWSPNVGLSNNTIQNPICSINKDTTYYVSYQDSNGCQLVDTFVVKINPDSKYAPFPDQQICMGDSTQLTIPIFASNIIWSPNQTISNTVIKNPYLFPTVSKTYYLNFIDTFGCSVRDTIFFKVDTCCTARAKFSLNDSIICFGDSLQITNQSTGILSYSWSFGNNAVPSIFSNPNPPKISFNQGGTFPIRLIVDNGICKDTLEQKVFVIQLHANAGQDTTVCLANITRSLGEIANADWQYSWTPTTGLNNPNIANPIATISQPTSYFLTIKDNATNCEAKDTVTISIKTNIDTTNTTTQICFGDSVNFFGGYVKKDSLYIHYIKATDGCDSAIFMLDLNVKMPLLINLPLIVACETYTDPGGQQFLNDTILNNAIKGLDGCDSILYRTAIHIIHLQRIDSTIRACEKFVYNTVEYTSSIQNIDSILIKSNLNNACDSLQIVYSIQIDAKPSITITSNIANPIPYGAIVELTASGGVSYQWNYNNSTSSTISYNAENNFTFIVTGYSADLCSDTAIYNIEVEDKNLQAIAVPTGFTPNGDGVNDFFYPIKKANVTINSMAIYNRWGQLIYFGEGNNSRWDGTFNNTAQPNEVYVYYIKYQQANTTKYLSGNVTLLR